MELQKGWFKTMDNKRLLNVAELQEYVGLGKSKSIEWGKAIGAEKRIGRRLLFDRVIVDKAIDELQTSDSDE